MMMMIEHRTYSMRSNGVLDELREHRREFQKLYSNCVPAIYSGGIIAKIKFQLVDTVIPSSALRMSLANACASQRVYEGRLW